MDAKVEKYTHRAELLQQEIERCEAELAEAEADRNLLQQKVDEQGLSIADIDRMNSERDRLTKGVESTQQRLEETKEKTAKKEAETSSRLDELESAVQQYNSLGYQVGVIPSAADNARGYHYELALQVNSGPDFGASQLGTSNQTLSASTSDRLLSSAHHGYQPTHLLPSTDLKATKRQLQELRKDISERRNVALEEDMAKVDMLDKTREALEDKAAELETLKHRVGAASEEFEKLREISGAQNMASEAQIERMEKELNKMRAGLGESVQLMEQREMGVNLEYEQMTLRCNALREELHTELERVLNEIIRFKIHVQSSLEGFDELVASEVDREFEKHDDDVTQASALDAASFDEDAMEE